MLVNLQLLARRNVRPEIKTGLRGLGKETPVASKSQASKVHGAAAHLMDCDCRILSWSPVNKNTNWHTEP